MHRDVRIENTACTHTNPRRWFLLDLECCARPGMAAPPLLTASFHGVLVDGCFTAASDIALLGQLLGVHSACVSSRAGQQFLAAVCVPAEQQLRSARQLLALPWLARGGRSGRGRLGGHLV